MDGDVTSIVESELAASLAELLTSYGDEVVPLDAVSLVVTSASVLVEATVIMATQEASDSVLFNLRAAPISQLSVALGYVIQSFSVSTRLIPVPPEDLAVSNDALETSGEGGGGGLGPIAGAAGGGALMLVCCISYILRRRARQRGQKEQALAEQNEPTPVTHAHEGMELWSEQKWETRDFLGGSEVKASAEEVNSRQTNRATWADEQGLNDEGVVSWSDISLHAILGSGNAARVFKASLSGDSRQLVLCRLNPEVVTAVTPAGLYEECQKLAKMEPDVKLVPFVAFALQGAKAGILFEYMPHSLARVLALADRSEAARIKLRNELPSLSVDIAEGIAALHERGFAHLSLHPGNVMLGHTLDVKLTDYGRDPRRLPSLETISDAEVRDSELADYESRLLYAAPEVLTASACGAAADIWSLAVLTIRLAVCHKPFESDAADGIHHILTRVASGELKPVSQLQDTPLQTSLLAKLVEQATSLEAEDRPTIEQFLMMMQRVSSTLTRMATSLTNRTQPKMAEKSTMSLSEKNRSELSIKESSKGLKTTVLPRPTTLPAPRRSIIRRSSWFGSSSNLAPLQPSAPAPAPAPDSGRDRTSESSGDSSGDSGYFDRMGTGKLTSVSGIKTDGETLELSLDVAETLELSLDVADPEGRETIVAQRCVSRSISRDLFVDFAEPVRASSRTSFLPMDRESFVPGSRDSMSRKSRDSMARENRASLQLVAQMERLAESSHDLFVESSAVESSFQQSSSSQRVSLGHTSRGVKFSAADRKAPMRAHQSKRRERSISEDEEKESVGEVSARPSTRRLNRETLPGGSGRIRI